CALHVRSSPRTDPSFTEALMNEQRAAAPATDPGHTAIRPLSALFWVAIAFSAYQIWMAAFHPLSSQVIRALHVGFVLLLIFVLFPPMGGRNAFWKALGWLLGLAGFASGLYQWVFEADLTLRAGELTQADWVLGIIVLTLVFE
ncbi:hypothetical protein RZS08_31800, partial [Arthrospira platensis SPKY1]|nr:hypothetical protein [Arthrospira platensis SPKY1]